MIKRHIGLIAGLALSLSVACGRGEPPRPIVDLDAVKALSVRRALTDFAEDQLRTIQVTPVPLSAEAATVTITNGTNLTLLGIDLEVSVRGPAGESRTPEPHLWQYHPSEGIAPRGEATVEMGWDVRDVPGANGAPKGSRYFYRPRRVSAYRWGHSIELDPVRWHEQVDLDLMLEKLTEEQRVEVDAYVAAQLAESEPIMRLAQSASDAEEAREARESSEREQAAVRRRRVQQSELARLRSQEQSRRREAQRLGREQQTRRAAPAPPAATAKAREQAPASSEESAEFLSWWKGCREAIEGVMNASRELESAARRQSYEMATKERRNFIRAVNAAVGRHDSHPPSPLDRAVDDLLSTMINAARDLEAKRFIAYGGHLNQAGESLESLDSFLEDLVRSL
jgi:hypothetical protein